MRHWLPGLLWPLILLLASLVQLHLDQGDLATYVWQHGRQVFTPGQLQQGFQPKRTWQLFDSDPDRPLIIRYPASTGEATYILVELGLSHSARRNGEKEARRRKLQQLRIWNGACAHCDRTRFQQTQRLKRIRLELYSRQANSIDQDYYYPPLQLLDSREMTLADLAGPLTVDYTALPLPDHSPGWPVHMRQYILKLIILETWAAENNPVRQPDGVSTGSDASLLAIGELETIDSELPLETR
ncbi:MAG: hypothetical protein KDK39_05490 [Leptospiraceae bacterium]|nr:hypothetical protein [Leptospiraceae bacterium]